MLRTLSRYIHRPEDGQALVLFAAGLIAFLGLVGMSIDVGRLVWARTSIQAGVDASALAAAQSMPSTSDATAKANEYWLDNSGFVQSQGHDIHFSVTFPPGNKALSVHADAEVDTWFLKLFGIPHWNVSADGDAASQVLDISVVLDISGSMCFDTFKQTEQSIAYQMSPGRMTPTGTSATSPGGAFQFPVLYDGDLSSPGQNPIPSTSTNSITIQLNDVRMFDSTNSTYNKGNFGTSFNSTTKYYQKSQSGNYRAGIIAIDNELFQITAVNDAAHQITVTRAMSNAYTGGGTAKASHAVGAEVWANRTGHSSTNDYCEGGVRYTPTTSQKGPSYPFDTAIADAQDFTTLFNSSYDKIGVADYSTTGATLSGLTSNFSSLRSSMDTILFPSGGTNTALGMYTGRQILDGSGKRANSARVLVLLTDGVPNYYCSNYASCSSPSSSTSPTSCPASTTAISEAVAQATAAKNEQITVYTIGLGDGVLDCVLQAVAAAGGGQYFKAPTASDLAGAFTSIAELTHIALIK